MRGGGSLTLRTLPTLRPTLIPRPLPELEHLLRVIPHMAAPTRCTRAPLLAQVQTLEISQHLEFVVLASDGLWDVISSAECIELVRAWVDSLGKGPQQVRHAPSRGMHVTRTEPTQRTT